MLLGIASHSSDSFTFPTPFLAPVPAADTGAAPAPGLLARGKSLLNDIKSKNWGAALQDGQALAGQVRGAVHSVSDGIAQAKNAYRAAKSGDFAGALTAAGQVAGDVSQV